MNLKNKLKIYTMLIVTLSLAFVSTFGFITHKKPKKKAIIHKNHQVIHNLSTFKSNLSTEKTNKRLLLYKLNTHGKEVIEKKVQQKVEQLSYITSFKATITAYTAGRESTGKSPGDKDYGKTTSGRYVKSNVTLSCPPSIPLGTWVKIDGIGKRRCDDRGQFIKGHHFDLYISSLKDAIQFGIQTKTVYILESDN